MRKRRSSSVKKSAILRLPALLLTAAILLSLAACAEPIALSYGKTEVSQSLYEYWYSSYKNYYLIVFDGENSPEYFAEVLDEETGLTVGEFYDRQIRGVIESNAASLYYFEKLGLSLTESRLREIDEQLNSEIENAGGRAALNEILGRMHGNTDTLRDAIEAEEKIAALYSYLFGDSEQGIPGSVTVSEEEKETFYSKRYVCVRQILLRTKEKNVVGEDGYALLDEDGNVLTEPMTAEETAAKYALRDEILQELEAGADFAELMEKYNEDSSEKTYDKGYLIASFSGFDAALTKTAQSLAIGEVGTCETSVGIHILIRDELPEKPWNDSIYQTMLQNFDSSLQNAWYDAMIEDVLSSLRRNDSATEEIRIENADISFWNQN